MVAGDGLPWLQVHVTVTLRCQLLAMCRSCAVVQGEFRAAGSWKATCWKGNQRAAVNQGCWAQFPWQWAPGSPGSTAQRPAVARGICAWHHSARPRPARRGDRQTLYVAEEGNSRTCLGLVCFDWESVLNGAVWLVLGSEKKHKDN